MTGRPPYTPTEEQRRTVRACRLRRAARRHLVGREVLPPTLRKWFRHELDVASIEANARVAQTLFQQATTPGNIAATIFWLKARARWREKQPVEHSGPEGTSPPGPTSITVNFVRPTPTAARAPDQPLIEGDCDDADR